MRIFATCSYKGTNYQGWQRQTNAPTIQEEIEKVLSKILNREIVIYASGRTDANVHALKQTFHFDLDKDDIDLEQLKYSVNCLLPKDIFISSLKEVSEDFHARFSAKEKVYSYVIRLGERNAFDYDLSYWLPRELDMDKMKHALTLFEGRHNFQDFNSKEEDEDNFIREISKTEFDFAEDEKILKITFRGNGFMRYQIRFMVGTLLAIGEGKEDESFITYHLNDKNREIVSYKAPGQGLYLKDVIY